jgi:hypothetical protein
MIDYTIWFILIVFFSIVGWYVLKPIYSLAWKIHKGGLSHWEKKCYEVFL